MALKNQVNTFRRQCENTLLYVIALIFLLTGCASTSPKIVTYPPDKILPPVGTSSMDPQKVEKIIKEIQVRNKTVEDSPEWIKRAYKRLMIRRLSNVSEKEYADYKKYLDNGAAYIIVHPAYFPFFHYPKRLSDTPKEGFYSKQNIIEKFLALPPPDRRFAVLQAQERRTRDFIEFKSTEEKLIIIIIPKNYHRYSRYTYRKGPDEYMRYLNEITNFSKSVLFVESRSANRGYPSEEDTIRLMEFLLSIGAKKIYIGGGYIGRCLEDFYAEFTEEFGRKGIYLVPELSDISPREISNSLAKRILTPDGRIDIAVATTNMKRDVYNVQEVSSDIINLP